MEQGPQENPFNNLKQEFVSGENKYTYFNLQDLKDDRLQKLPYSIRVLLESAIRNCDEFAVSKKDVETILNWVDNAPKKVEIPFKPARVIL